MKLDEYFALHRYKAKYEMGARVTGKWNKIPFVGSVGNDTELHPDKGPYLTVHLDLPICFEGTVYNVIICKHKDVKAFK